MQTQQDGCLQALEDLSHQLKAWRECDKRTERRIPEEIWGQAVALASEHGAYKVAKGLRLNYGDLKKRMKKEEPQESKTLTPAFLEFFSPSIPSASIAHCSMEIESAKGGKLHIEIKDIATCELAALLRGFVAP